MRSGTPDEPNTIVYLLFAERVKVSIDPVQVLGIIGEYHDILGLIGDGHLAIIVHDIRYGFAQKEIKYPRILLY